MYVNVPHFYLLGEGKRGFGFNGHQMAVVLHVSALVSHAIVKEVEIRAISINKIKIAFSEDSAAVVFYFTFNVLPSRKNLLVPL